MNTNIIEAALEAKLRNEPVPESPYFYVLQSSSIDTLIALLSAYAQATTASHLDSLNDKLDSIKRYGVGQYTGTSY